MSMVLMLIFGPLQGGVVDYGLGGERASGGIEIVVILISSFRVSGQEMDSWSWRAVPWSRRTVAQKTGRSCISSTRPPVTVEFNVTLIVSTV